ncbi:NAD+ synthase (glutamine-hydrolysing) [Ruminococcaceae bacterium YRB3002]|nr:NAD+ synthase (glutamine-hydrolysing) [Ruminococcaceae bacterium YRB3002]
MRDGFIRVGAATPRVKVADCFYNADRIIDLAHEAAESGISILTFPELSITGYTCQDMFLHKTLVDSAFDALVYIADNTAELEMMIVVGLPVLKNHKLYDCAAAVCKGEILGIVPKSIIPGYGEFYEQRYFMAYEDDDDGAEYESIPFGKMLFEHEDYPEVSVGIEICEELWVPDNPSVDYCMSGATIILNPSASDEVIGKASYRRDLVKMASAKQLCAYVYCDCGFGESSTDLVFAGHDIISENGKVLEERRGYEESIIWADVDLERIAHERLKMNTFYSETEGSMSVVYMDLDLPDIAVPERPIAKMPFVPESTSELDSRCEDIINMQAMGLATRLSAINCTRAVIGLSGGLDSTLAFIVTVHAFDHLSIPRDKIVAVTMPCFGTTSRTKNNSVALAESYGVPIREINIAKSVLQHFEDIGKSADDRDVTYENAQARERTQVLMDIANQIGGLVVGTGDLSELALGWATYNGDHMSMYGVNGSIPKTLVRHLVCYEAKRVESSDPKLSSVLMDIFNTPVSPELLPPDESGNIAQKTEDIVGPYELHDFFLYYFVRFGFAPSKIYRMAKAAFDGEYDDETIYKWLATFIRRFFTQQFKRSCLPDGPKVGTVALSPRGDLRMSSDTSYALWMEDLESVQDGECE